MSKAREAILQAAAYIERHPEKFEFFNGEIPKRQFGQTGCALGWAGYYMNKARPWWQRLFGLNRVRGLERVAQLAGFPDDGVFYGWMDRASAKHKSGWRKNPEVAARYMRQYAERL